MRKILVIDRYFWPDLQATSALLTDLVGQLSRDFEITVLCGPASDFRAGGSRSEELKSVRVRKIPCFQFNNPTFFKRFLNYASYLLLLPFAVLFAKRPDAALVQSSPPLQPFMAGAAFWLRRIPFIYVCQDFFPGTATRSGQLKENFLTRFFGFLHRVANRLASRVIVIGRDMHETLIEEGADVSKIDVISNWADLSEIKVAPRRNSFSRAHGLDDDFVVMHAGNFGLVQDFDFLLEIASCLISEERIRIVFVGGGASRKEVEKKAAAKKLSNVLFIPFAPRNEISDVLGSADLHLISLKKGLAGYSVPSKTYALMASGRPILALLEKRSETARLIEEAGCGVVIDSFSAEEVTRWVKEVCAKKEELENWGRRARRFMEETNFRARAREAYEKHLSEMAR